MLLISPNLKHYDGLDQVVQVVHCLSVTLMSVVLEKSRCSLLLP